MFAQSSRRMLIIGSVFMLLPFVVLAQTDTLKISHQKAEELFLAHNLQLIAQRYNVEQAKAEVITAKLFDNPQFTYENVFYNPDTKKYFQTSSADGQGQYQAQLSQLFKLAGKRNKSIQLATTGLKVAEYEFADLVRTLRYTLRTNYHTIYYKQQSAAIYETELNSLKQLLGVYKVQLQKGNVAEKELLRIQSLLYTLQAEQAQVLNELEDVQTELRQLLGVGVTTVIVPDDQDEKFATDIVVTKITYASLLDSALVNRPDLNVAKTNIDYANINLKLQKAMGVPDLTISASYDLQGSYIKNYNGVGVSLSLPFFNRNQGVIKQAHSRIAQRKAETEVLDNQIKNELSASYQRALRLAALHKSVDPTFKENFKGLIEQVNLNFQKRNIGMLEFLDFYDSYKVNTLQLNSLTEDLLNTLEELNYLTATPFFNR
ncbi:Cobalt-zinc-cadmium resistance protein CzcC precursor [compost metagenome]